LPVKERKKSWEIVDDLKALEKDIDAQMSFGGSGGKLQVPL
jgi:hypothetical protein